MALFYKENGDTLIELTLIPLSSSEIASFIQKMILKIELSNKKCSKVKHTPHVNFVKLCISCNLISII